MSASAGPTPVERMQAALAAADAAGRWVSLPRGVVREVLAELASSHTKPEGAPVTEYGQQMSGGGWHLRWDDPVVEEEWPTKDWIEAKQRHGGVVGKRTVIVVKDWKCVPKRRKPAPQASTTSREAS